MKAQSLSGRRRGHGHVVLPRAAGSFSDRRPWLEWGRLLFRLLGCGGSVVLLVQIEIHDKGLFGRSRSATVLLVVFDARCEGSRSARRLEKDGVLLVADGAEGEIGDFVVGRLLVHGILEDGVDLGVDGHRRLLLHLTGDSAVGRLGHERRTCALVPVDDFFFCLFTRRC